MCRFLRNFFKPVESVEEGGYYGYQVAGKNFLVTTKKTDDEYLKSVLCDWFQYPLEKAVRILTYKRSKCELDESVLYRSGVILASQTADERYLFKKKSAGVWDVTRLNEKPVMKK